jgi:predicted ATPase
MPLAIELAAAMTDVLDLPAIATEIERNLDVLSTDRQDVHARHRSVRAVFDSSWQTLTSAEQAVFARLSVIRGSFTREAAAQISQATLDDLASLVNKSLLRHRSSGRYEIHELMRQYAAEKLAATPAEQEAAEQRHCHYYQQFLSQSLTKWQTNYHPQNMAGIALEIDNLRAGWQWALTREELKVVWSYTENLWPFYKARGRFSEAVETLTQTLRLMAANEHNATQGQQAECERLLGEAYFGLGQIGTSQKHLYRALELVGQPAPAAKGRTLLTFCWQILCHLMRRIPAVSGKRYSEQEKQSFLVAAKIYDRISYIDYMTSRSIPYATIRGLNLAEMAGPSPILAITYANMSSFYSIISRRHWADYYAHLAEKIINRFHDLPARAAVTLRIAIYHGPLGRWEQATVEGLRALRWYQQLEDQRNWGDCLAALGIISLMRGHFHDSITYTAALQALAAGNYNIEHQSWAVCGPALGLLRLGRTEEALALATEITPLINQEDRTTYHARAAYYSVIAAAHLRKGEKEQALWAADSAVALLRNKASLNIAVVLFYSHVAEVYLTLWEQVVSEGNATGQANLLHLQAQAQQICQTLYRFAWLLSTRRPFAYLYQGHYDWLAGRRRRARRLWFKSLANAKRLASPHIEGIAHYQIGRHLPLDDARRAVHLRRAVEIFENLKAEYDLNQAQITLAEGK